MIQALSGFIQYLYLSLPRKARWRIVIECEDLDTAYHVKSVFSREFMRNSYNTDKPIDPRQPLSLADMEVCGTPVEIRARIV